MSFAQSPGAYWPSPPSAWPSWARAPSPAGAPARCPGATTLWALLILPVYYLRSEVRPPAEGPVSLQGLMRFQQSADEMTGSTAWVQEIPRWSPLADQIMAGIEITTKVDYTEAYATGKLAVHSMEMGTTHEKVWFQADDDTQVIRFYTFYHPGWNAYILDETTGAVTGRAPVIPEGDLGRINVPLPQPPRPAARLRGTRSSVRWGPASPACSRLYGASAVIWAVTRRRGGQA